MLALLRHRLILAALLAASAASSAQDSAATWSWGVGQALEVFHWHETSEDIWYTASGTPVDRGEIRFLSENGTRWNTFATFWYEAVPGLRIKARAGYTYGSVDYDGGLQAASAAALADWPIDTAVVGGDTLYQYAKVPYATVTGYFGPDLEIGMELRPHHRTGQVYPRGELAYCYSSLRRKIAYTTTRASGYDEVWTREWVRIAAGGGWSTRQGELLATYGLRMPLSTEEDIEEVSGGAEITPTTLKPDTRLAWEASLAWESLFGLELKARYSRQIFDESPISGDSNQPFSYESIFRLEAGWNF